MRTSAVLLAVAAVCAAPAPQANSPADVPVPKGSSEPTAPAVPAADVAEWIADKVGSTDHGRGATERVRFELSGGRLLKSVDGQLRVGGDDTFDTSGVVTQLTWTPQEAMGFHWLRDQHGWGTRAGMEEVTAVLELADRAGVPHNVPRLGPLPGGSGRVQRLAPENWTAVVMEPRANVFVRFCVPWSGFCRGLRRDMKELAKAFEGQGDIIVADVDMEAYPELAKEQGVTGFPTLLYYTTGAKGQPFRFRGPPYSRLAQFLESHRGLDPGHHARERAQREAADKVERGRALHQHIASHRQKMRNLRRNQPAAADAAATLQQTAARQPARQQPVPLGNAVDAARPTVLTSPGSAAR
eukprot:TRINITY_DN65091_c0_g1_i1.p1 TRINITY_DN65091_c0_g1~~TRINITY_DN65091_c0_g1_i1.p1  ORF type:complete len:377 (+),score=111.29 TRINITY_DN65091_c0_g1_i1:67-1131(+)